MCVSQALKLLPCSDYPSGYRYNISGLLIDFQYRQKKLLTKELVGVMKNNDIDCWNTGEGKLIYSKTKSKAPLSKKHLLNSLLKYFQNDENTAKELSKFIMETREIKEKENIRRKIPKIK